MYTQTCSEKVDGVCVIEGIFGPGKDEMVEMIPGERAPKAGKSTLGGGKLWWRSGGARRRQGTARRHTFGLWRVCFPPVLIRTDRRLLV